MVEADINKENEEEPSFSDPEDFVDDFPDDELVPDVLRQKPSIDEYEECCLVIFGIPVVGPERISKLQTVLNKIFTNVNANYKAHFPLTADGGSKGCVFIEWCSKAVASYAKDVLDGYKLDKSHVFSALLFNDIRRIEKPSETWNPPQPAVYTDVGDLWWWMQNNRCRDQFAVQYDKDGVPTVACYWHIKGHEPEIAGEQGKAERSNWTDTVFNWSPHGSYLTTIHQRGIILWGGPDFQRCQRFAHDNVQFIDFSPCETFLVTYAAVAEKDRWGDDEDCIRIWDVRTGEMKKGFSLYALANRDQLPCWPFFQWSHDEKYFACLKAPEKDKLEKEKKVNGVSVFDTEKFSLVDRRHVIIDNIKSFSWSPTQNIIAYYSEVICCFLILKYWDKINCNLIFIYSDITVSKPRRVEKKIMSAFDMVRQKNLKHLACLHEERIKLRGGVDTDAVLSTEDLVEEQIMVALNTQKTLAPLGDEIDE
uniref:Eukaryotic translation initiation factor 3 subunit 9 n=1 Tax=Heterorhabditis bacteriophora TaxID=37862 RepID=A0A1I7XQ51_HETBA